MKLLVPVNRFPLQAGAGQEKCGPAGRELKVLPIYGHHLPRAGVNLAMAPAQLKLREARCRIQNDRLTADSVVAEIKS
jgi:hypothetical protein